MLRRPHIPMHTFPSPSQMLAAMLKAQFTRFRSSGRGRAAQRHAVPKQVAQTDVADDQPSTSQPSTPHAPQPLPVSRRNPVQIAAAAAVLSLTAEATYTYLEAQPQLPPLSDVLGLQAAILAASLGSLGALVLWAQLRKAANGEADAGVHVELHAGRLYVSAACLRGGAAGSMSLSRLPTVQSASLSQVQLGVPSRGPPLAPGAVTVRPTGDVRGNGAFAATHIPAGTHVGDYTGELLDRAQFAQRYPELRVRS